MVAGECGVPGSRPRWSRVVAGAGEQPREREEGAGLCRGVGRKGRRKAQTWVGVAGGEGRRNPNTRALIPR